MGLFDWVMNGIGFQENEDQEDVQIDEPKKKKKKRLFGRKNDEEHEETVIITFDILCIGCLCPA